MYTLSCIYDYLWWFPYAYRISIIAYCVLKWYTSAIPNLETLLPQNFKIQKNRNNNNNNKNPIIQTNLSSKSQSLSFPNRAKGLRLQPGIQGVGGALRRVCS